MMEREGWRGREGGEGSGGRERRGEGKPLPPLLTPGGTTLSAPDAEWLSALFPNPEFCASQKVSTTKQITKMYHFDFCL